MSETIIVADTQDKEERYKTLLPQIEALINGEEDLIANLANVAAALKETFNFFWVGFYVVKNGELVLGPFQGPVACTRISLGRGVCGTAWQKKESVIVADVDKFPGHIACNAASKSEIVVPAIKSDKVVFILDVDSDRLNDFDNVDQEYLEKLLGMLVQTI